MGWIVIALGCTILSGLVLATCVPHLDTTTRALILQICGTSAGALGATLTIRRPTTPAADTTQQVVIPNGDPQTPPIMVNSTTGLAPQEARPALKPAAP